ncbi:MAG: ATP-binding protein [bacterium]
MSAWWRPGGRGAIFLISSLLICVAGARGGCTSRASCGRAWRAHHRELVREAQLIGASEGQPVDAALARRLADRLGGRVTFIDPSQVVGDAPLDAAAEAALRAAPDVRAALETGTGTLAAVGEGDWFYASVRVGPRVIRVGRSPAEVQTAVRRIRVVLLTAVGIGLVGALFMTILASWLLARPLRDLLVRARTLTDGPAHAGRRETSIKDLGRQLEEVVATLASERDQIEAVLEGMTEAVLGLDPEGRLTLVNRAGLRLLGVETPPLGQPVAGLMPVLDVSEGVHEVTLPGARAYLARVTPQRSGRGRVMVLLDVTRLRRLEQIRRDFVANVSHELRTPVSIIRANAETLRDGALADPAQARGFVDALLRNAERLSDLLADLLDIARIESGQAAPRVPVAVIEPAIAAYEQVEPRALARDITLDFDLEEGLCVLGDAKALSQVLTNLLENGVKYIPAGGRVALTGRRVGDRAILEVSDDGPGIAEEHRERIFERFYRVDAGRSTDAGGTGLGLAIVKHLCGAMGGSVRLEQARPHGARFVVDLAAADSA